MSDVLLDTAVANWGPRFTANGVDASDYARITGPLEHWMTGARRGAPVPKSNSNWAKWPWQKTVDEVPVSTSPERRRTSISASSCSCTTWTRQRTRTPAPWTRSTARRPVRAPGSRHEIPFENSKLVGLFRRPHVDGPHPTVLLIPGLDSTKDEFREVERSFHDRGMATFALDGPGQGEAEWALPIRPEWEVVGETVIGYLQSMPDVDSNRIGVWECPWRFLRRTTGECELAGPGDDRARRPYNLGATWKDLNPLTRHAFEVRSYSPSPEAAERRAWDMTLEGFAEKITTPSW